PRDRLRHPAGGGRRAHRGRAPLRPGPAAGARRGARRHASCCRHASLTRPAAGRSLAGVPSEARLLRTWRAPMLVANVVIETLPGKARAVAERMEQMRGMGVLSMKIGRAHV